MAIRANKSRAIRPSKASTTGSLAGGSVLSEISVIRHGYSWGSAARVQRQLALNDPQFAGFLGVSGRTLARQKKSARPLDRVASDRLYRLMRVASLAGRVLEDADLGLQWLRRPQPGLGGAVPLDLLDTEPGFEAVESLLQRIEYGAIA